MTGAERARRHRQLRQNREDPMTEATALRVPPPLPDTSAALLAQYKLKRKRSINDLVEEVIVKLWDANEDFMKLINAVYDSQAVEGSLDDDDTMAAQIIRNYAKENKHVEVAQNNLHTIKLAMRVGLRRFGVDRPTREDLAQLPKPSELSSTETAQLPAAE
jgi:predicted polyphosphate/ATP-dependent NAD kinase